MKSRISSNKKGIAIDDTIAMIIFIFVVVLGVFSFSINEKVKGKALTTDIQSQKDILSGHEALVDYIKETDGNTNKADILAKSVLEKNYELIKKDMLQYFGKKFSGIDWHIDVKDSSQNLLFQIQSASLAPSGEYTASSGAPYFITSLVVPISGTDYASIELFYIR